MITAITYKAYENNLKTSSTEIVSLVQEKGETFFKYVFEITFEDLLKKNEVHSPKSEIQLKVFVTSFRNCIVDETAFGFGNRFVCELNSIEYSGSETNVPEVIQLSFNSKEVFKLRLCNLHVFQFQDDCGIPDIP